MGSIEFTPGRFVWRELVSQDPASSQRFYAELFGWTFDTRDAGYTQILSGDRRIGGMVQASYPSLRTFWLPYVSVGDVEVAAKRAADAGCSRTIGPMDTGQGQFVVLNDPQGAPFGVWHGAQGDPALAERPAIGTFCWEQLNTPDGAASVALYASTFEWGHAAFPGQAEMSVFSREGAEVASLMQGPRDMPAHWLSYVAVEALAGATGRAERLGGTVLVERVALAGLGAFAVLQDPLGAVIAVFEAG